MVQNRWIILSIILITPIGFYSKFYNGYLHYWVNNSLGGVFYEIFWCLVLALFFRRLTSFQIAASVLIATCILEFLQLWHPPFLEALRHNFFGVTILGNAFTWSDFPYYFIGSFLGYFLIIKLKPVPVSTEISSA
ncbi:MAG: DUF2809 domain-containing protein [Candidatus Marinimicrobia bacterium]|nr:DUF2809 domain-containing protein [Candidatus Neomarinimicrobiota bacterium]